MICPGKSFTLGGQVSLTARDGQDFFIFYAPVLTLSLCKRCAIEYDIDVYKITNTIEKVNRKSLFAISHNTESREPPQISCLSA